MAAKIEGKAGSFDTTVAMKKKMVKATALESCATGIRVTQASQLAVETNLTKHEPEFFILMNTSKSTGCYKNWKLKPCSTALLSCSLKNEYEKSNSSGELCYWDHLNASIPA